MGGLETLRSSPPVGNPLLWNTSGSKFGICDSLKFRCASSSCKIIHVLFINEKLKTYLHQVLERTWLRYHCKDEMLLVDDALEVVVAAVATPWLVPPSLLAGFEGHAVEWV